MVAEAEGLRSGGVCVPRVHTSFRAAALAAEERREGEIERAPAEKVGDSMRFNWSTRQEQGPQCQVDKTQKSKCMNLQIKAT